MVLSGRPLLLRMPLRDSFKRFLKILRIIGRADFPRSIEKSFVSLNVGELGAFLNFWGHWMTVQALESSYVRSHDERVNSVIAQMATAIRTLARSTTKDTAVSLEFSYSLGGGDCLEKVDVGACPCLPSVPNEVVRAEINEDDFSSAGFPIRDLLRLELEPFIIGVGWVIVDEISEGIVVRRCDLGKIEGAHHINTPNSSGSDF